LTEPSAGVATMSPARVTCCVPFCRRTTKKLWDDYEWICAVHWPMVTRRTKRRRVLAKRALKRARFRFEKICLQRKIAAWTRSERGRVEAARRLAWALWERCKREAIETAAGL
jgi:ABC-type iron transport system FetAB ATPase subunit